MIDMFGAVGVGMEVLWDCWGDCELEGTRDDNITPYSVKYL